MANILIIYTGGTIGGKIQQDSSVIQEDLSKKGFIHQFKEDFNLKEEGIIDFIIPTRKLSEQIDPLDWSLIATSVDKAIKKKADGVVVLHGTDTMTYTACALSFMLAGVKIPVILTGANKAYTERNTDAKKNIMGALFVAKQENFNGIYIVFSGNVAKNSYIHLGTRVRKQTFGNYFSYISVNYPTIGEIKQTFSGLKVKYTDKKTFDQLREKIINSQPYELKEKVKDNVSFFKVFPGFNPKHIDIELEGNTKGIILELYGSGTACTQGKYSLIPSLKRVNQNKIPVFITSQHFGNTELVTYGSAQQLKEAGVISLKDMLTEAAIVKLMWVLGITNDKEKIIELMLKNIAGELSE